jgi:hypothetical protein
MSDVYGLWQRGPHKPGLVTLHERGKNIFLSADEKERALSQPVRIADEHVGLTLAELEKLYPLRRE